MFAKLSAEFIGTFWLVLGGCGSAVLAAAFPEVGIGFTGVSLAFGLTVLTGAYALGPISGGHFNPAVSVGLWAGGRFPAAQLLPYIVAQVAGAVVAAGVLYVIASGKADFSLAGGFASNGYGEHSPGQILAHGGAGERSRDDVHVPDRDSRRDSQARAGRLRRPRDRSHAHADPPDQHSGDEHVRESGAQHRAGALRRRLGAGAAVAVLAGADRRRRNRGLLLSISAGGRAGTARDRTQVGLIRIHADESSDRGRALARPRLQQQMRSVDFRDGDIRELRRQLTAES